MCKVKRDLSGRNLLDEPEDLSDRESEVWVDVAVVADVTDVLFLPSSVVAGFCDGFSCCSNREFEEPQSLFSSKSERFTGSRCYVGGRVDTSGHFIIVSNHKVFYDVAFARVWCVFSHVKSLFLEKRICVLVQIDGILCINGHMRIHTRTPKNTTFHHPPMHSDNDTDQNTTIHCISVHIWISLASVCIFFRASVDAPC